MTNYRVINKVRSTRKEDGSLRDVSKRISTLIWGGEHYPTLEELSDPVGDIMTRALIRGDYDDIFYDRTLQVQEQRIPRLLGWKILKTVGIKEFIPSDTLDT